MPPKKKSVSDSKRSRSAASSSSPTKRSTSSRTASPSKHARTEEDTDITSKKKNESKKVDDADGEKQAEAKSTEKKMPSSKAVAAAKKTVPTTTDGPKTQHEQEIGCVDFASVRKDTKFDASKHIKLISWNVAGLRAVLTKNPKELQNLVNEEQPDVVCLQETKLSDWTGLDSLGELDGYTHADTISTAKKGYSGCRTYVKKALDSVHTFGFDRASPSSHDHEGRVITTNVYNFTLVNTYVPNAGMTLDRLPYRVDTFDSHMRSYLKSLNAATGKVIWTGDLNVAERDYDRYFKAPWKAMQKCAGFTPEERASFRKTLSDLHMVDAFRHVYPNACGPKMMTFFSNRVGGPASGLGWRLDYFVVSAALASKVVDCYPIQKWATSDHKPLCLLLSH